MKKISLYLLAGFYVLAGANHFVNPTFYYPLIPPYIGSVEIINELSGVIEILLGVSVLWSKTKRVAAIGLILMLVAFIPSHIYFIQIGSCIKGGLCVPSWIGWGRLLLIHPLLMFWAFYICRS